MDSREPAQGRQKMAVGTRIILGPIGVAFAPIAVCPASESDAERDLGIHQAGEDKLSLFAIIGGQREVVVLHAGEFAERALERAKRAKQRDYTRREPPQLPGAHDSRVARAKF